jgi:glyoxylase-like metal-dependent hydrolase (beta-lactamase superfamily II)
MPLTHRALHLGPLDNNTYVLVDVATRETAIVDPGFEPEVVIEAVRDGGLTVRWILLTHAHYDHACGARTVQAALGGVVRMHPADRPLLAVLDQQGAMFGFPPAQPPDTVVDLEDGERVPLGEESIAVLHTPGHAPGHVCFHHDRWLWGGDALFAGSIGRTDLPGGSFEQLERAIRTRLFTLGDDVQVFPGHGPATTIGHERLHNPFVGDAARFA